MSETPAELLEHHIVLNMRQLAAVLELVSVRGERRGKPDSRKARALIRDGSIRLIDPTQPVSRWAVSANEIRRYIENGPRRIEGRAS